MPRVRSREKFVDLAEKRMKKAIKALRLVGNLSNKSNYKYEEKDVEQILKTLNQELNHVKTRFSEAAGGGDIDFKL